MQGRVAISAVTEAGGAGGQSWAGNEEWVRDWTNPE